METPAHPLGQTLVGRQGGGGGARVLADYEGRVYKSGEGPPEDREEDTGGEEGGPGPP